ncbi:MAG: tyrosine-type recombinase/integrase [bacterium]|nr:tyrosine-type recombinase/integrase [bacterium]MDD4152504.1 tyrosine-type recombinase/integrase [bacterium]MDD4558232.1 tyrosine-type recombinase/integrase [bacterium]
MPEKPRLHAFCHTCATLLYEDVQDIKQVSDYLGHADIGTTANIYTHIFPDMKARAVASLSDKLLPHFVVSSVVNGKDKK